MIDGPRLSGQKRWRLALEGMEPVVVFHVNLDRLIPSGLYYFASRGNTRGIGWLGFTDSYPW